MTEGILLCHWPVGIDITNSSLSPTLLFGEYMAAEPGPQELIEQRAGEGIA